MVSHTITVSTLLLVNHFSHLTKIKTLVQVDCI